MRPVMALLQHQYLHRARIETIETDRPDDPAEAARLSAAAHLHYTPTFLVVDQGGRATAKFVGPTSYAALSGALERALRPTR